MNRSFFLICLISFFTFSQDLSNQGVEVKPLNQNDSEIKNDVWTFNPLSIKRRTPFTPPGDLIDKKTPPEFKFDLSSYELVGIAFGPGRPRALFVTPDGKSIIRRTNQKLGRRKGIVTSITKDLVTVTSNFIDNNEKKQKINVKFSLDD